MSVESTVAAVEHRFLTSDQTDMKKQWSDRMERVDIITLNTNETLNSVVERQGREVMSLTEKKGGGAASTVATSQGNGGSIIGHGKGGARVGFTPSRGGECGRTNEALDVMKMRSRHWQLRLKPLCPPLRRTNSIGLSPIQVKAIATSKCFSAVKNGSQSLGKETGAA